MRVAYEYRVVCGASSALRKTGLRTLTDAEHARASLNRYCALDPTRHSHRIERRELRPGLWRRVA